MKAICVSSFPPLGVRNIASIFIGNPAARNGGRWDFVLRNQGANRSAAGTVKSLCDR
jgi:hypothetical protein